MRLLGHVDPGRQHRLAGAPGGGGHPAWRSARPPGLRWCGRAAAPRAKGRVPATPPTPEALPAFQPSAHAPRPRALPATPTRPVRVCSPDARRCGGLPVRRHRRTAYGVPPVGGVPPVSAWLAVSGAVAPPTGARCCLARPSWKAERGLLCVQAFAEAAPDRLNLRLLDHRGTPPARRLTRPGHVRLGCLPPYGPELKPLERVWRDRQEALAWRQGPPSGGATRRAPDAPPGVSGRHATIAHGRHQSRRGRSSTMSIMMSYQCRTASMPAI